MSLCQFCVGSVMPCYIKLDKLLYYGCCCYRNLIPQLNLVALPIVSCLVISLPEVSQGDDQPQALWSTTRATRATTDHESYDWPRDLWLTTRKLWATMRAVTNHKCYDQPWGTIDHESYDWPRELRSTTRATIDHESYDRPRELRLTTRATIDHESYDRPWELWLTTRLMTDHKKVMSNHESCDQHKCYDRPRELRLTTRINVLWVVICIVIRAQSKILTLTLLCPSPIHH